MPAKKIDPVRAAKTVAKQDGKLAAAPPASRPAGRTRVRAEQRIAPDGVPFFSAKSHGFARVASCCTPISIADPAANATAIVDMARACSARGVDVAVFTELSLSGYSIEDLLMQDALLEAVRAALGDVVRASAALPTVLIVGAPVLTRGRIYNTAVVVHRGVVLGVVPKSYLPTYREFYERRQVADGADEVGEIALADLLGGGEESLFGSGAKPTVASVIPFGANLLFTATDVPGLVLHVEICEDFWVPVPPSAMAALAGATVIANLSGSPITIGRAESRRLLAQSASARCLAAYLYAAAGGGESTTEVAWDGQLLIYENGELLAEAERFLDHPEWIVADVDLDRLRQERLRMGTFDDNRRAHGAVTADFRRIGFVLGAVATDRDLLRDVPRFPFVPSDAGRLHQDCYEAYNIQVAALAQRLRATGIKRVVIGISGGLDSTQALIVAAKAFDRLGLPREDILTYTMPGFATGEASKGYAWRLMRSMGTRAEELDIRPAAEQMLRDMAHPFADGQSQYDVTFENVQAGLRTDYLFRLANHHQGIVIGTGDLSEMALGWCTYGVGDQMSHYAVNAGVPKTLMQHLIRWSIVSGQFAAPVNAVLADILGAEISPELVPAQDGVVQSTESLVGPYALHDLFLFYIARLGFKPSKVAYLAWQAWHDPEQRSWPAHFPDENRRAYALDDIRHWLAVFIKRFFGFSQFKRSAIPNGPKISAGGALSPRGDWRAPSDGNARIWLADLEKHVPKGH